MPAYLNLSAARLDILGVLLLAFLSWATYRLLGLSYDPSPLNGYFQFIDMVLLQTRLIESLVYYHANPPFLNLVAGLGLKLAGEHYLWFFSAVYHGLGLLLALSFMVLVRELTGNRQLALVATGLLVFSPAFVLYENWLMYTFPAATFITVSALCLLKIVRGGSNLWLHGFFITLALLVLTRSMFHLGWMILVVLIGLWLLPGRRSALLVAALVPVLACTLWYGKNQLLFGQFSASSWLGLGLSNITTLTVPREKLEPYVADGTLSPFALRSRYVEENLFVDLGLPPTGIAVLDNVKTVTDQYNFNHQNILVMGQVYRSDGLKVMRLFPGYYLRAVARANRQFFTTNSDSPFFWPQSKAVFDGVREVYSVVFYGAGVDAELLRIPRLGDEAGFNTPSNPGYTTIVLWIVTIGFAARVFIRGITGREEGVDYIVIGYIAFSMLYVYSLSTLIELMENYRYRFLVEPVYWVLVAVVLARTWQGLRGAPR